MGYRKEWSSAYTKAKRRDPRTWPKDIIHQIRRRAKKRGMQFDLAPEDLVVPAVCPVLGLKLEPGAGVGAPNSPSVDRFDNTEGYVRDNVRIVSRRANWLKSDATAAEMRAVLAYMEGRPTPTQRRRQPGCVREIADEMGIGKSSVYRVIASRPVVISNTPLGMEPPEGAASRYPSSRPMSILRGVWMSFAYVAAPIS